MQWALRGSNSLMSPNDKFFGNFFMAGLFIPQSFCQKSTERKSLKKFLFFIFGFLCLAWYANWGFTSNKSTHYLLDYGDDSLSKLCTRYIRDADWKADASKTNTVWCGFWSRGIIGSFASKLSKEKPLQSMAIVFKPCWTNFCVQKLKRRILATGLRYVQHSRNYTRCFGPCFWRSHYQQQS